MRGIPGGKLSSNPRNKRFELNMRGLLGGKISSNPRNKCFELKKWGLSEDVQAFATRLCYCSGGSSFFVILKSASFGYP